VAKERPFNNPFGKLKLKRDAPRALSRPPSPPPPNRVPQNHAEDEAEFFRAFVGEVDPVDKGPKLVRAPAPQRALRVVDEDDEALAELCELVAGSAPFDLTASDEHIEGAVGSLDERVLRRLRAGDYAVQAHLDLHGLTRVEAKGALERFVEASRRKGHRCVLVVHGRGLHSKDRLPILKEGLQRWLTRGRIGRQVLAFTTARPQDGGFGAVYVLLRR